MDELMTRRFDALTARLETLEAKLAATGAELGSRIDGVAARVDGVRDELIDHTRQVELRITTEIHAVGGQIRDVLDLLRDRKAMDERIRLLEERLTRMEQGRRDA